MSHKVNKQSPQPKSPADGMKGGDSSFEVRDFGADPQPFSPDGVDITLIHWMLSLTPEQRLRVLQQNVPSILKLREQMK